MTISEKLKQLYDRYDFLIDCDRKVQARTVQMEIRELELLREESYTVMKRKFTHKQIIVGVIVTAYLTMLIGGIVTVLSNLDSVSYGIY